MSSGRDLTAAKLELFDHITCMPSLGHLDVRIAWRLLSRVNVNAGCSWPSYGRLAKEVGCHRQTAIKAVRRLIEAGVFIKKGVKLRPDENTTNQYWPNFDLVAHTLPADGNPGRGGKIGRAHV